MLETAWAAWRGARPASDLLHLDSAACGRPSLATLTAVEAHARMEAREGGYVAEAAAEPVLTRLRAHLGTLLGVPADGVAFTESGSSALDVLIWAWHLAPGGRVGVAASEWGPNLETFTSAGLEPVPLAVGPDGVIDLERLDDQLTPRRPTRPPDVVHVVHAAAHRGLVQPVAEVASRCRAAGVPLWVDAAQALGHVECATGADAVYATGRKWLAGPRGVGILAVAQGRWDRLRLRPRAKHPADLPPVRTLESEEAHVAGRVGLAQAVRELMDSGPGEVAVRLEQVGRHTREAVAGLDGWAVVGEGPAGAITALRPTRGQDVAETRHHLLADHRILTTACLPWRAPREPAPAALRLSPHVDVTDEDLARLVAALARPRSGQMLTG